MPKAGSSFLTRAIAALPGMRNAKLVPAYGGREQELSLRRLLHYRRKNYVAQLHLRYSAWTGKLIRKYHLTPVILVRDLFDVVISYRDHIRRGETIGPSAWLTDYHVRLPDAALERAIVLLAMPWYLNFYMSWRKFEPKLLVRYEDMREDPVTTIATITKTAGKEFGRQAIERAVDSVSAAKARFNVGIAGRGESLNREAREMLLEMLRLYPEARYDPYVAAMIHNARAATTGYDTANTPPANSQK
jgi:hypothetical protein